ncbi:MOSC domain-containing protein [Streptomyces sp. NPDC004610]|uniref:MOSC domain-containing protein n=1 Tax=unclassified Streptomyces TaxID=2593676 RepID=UPI0033A76C15
MKLLNFSIGKVTVHDMGGQDVPSAHIKSPAPRPWLITPDGPLGNEKAVHVDAVYAFSRDHYRYWGEELGTAPDSWPDGFFGENLTLTDFDETEIRLGDEFALGDEVRLVVAGPRVPCWKLAWRLGLPKTFLSRFAVSGHTGMYLGVIDPGEVRPGDALRLLRRDERNPTVADLAHYCSGGVEPPLEPLRRALDQPCLSGTVRLVLGAKATGAARRIRPRAWQGWRPFTVSEVVRESPEVCSFALRPDDEETLPEFRPGQFVSVRLPAQWSESGASHVRQWSLSEHTEKPGTYRVTVKDSGLASGLMHTRATTGTSLALRAPAGSFTLDTGGFRPVVLIAAGIGITPILAMLQAHVRRGTQAPPLYLLYGAKNRSRQPFRDEIDRLIAELGNATATHVFSAPEEYDRPGTDFQIRGRITLPLVLEILKDNYLGDPAQPLRIPWYEADFYLCGPDEMCTGLRDALIEEGANPDRTFTEVFTPVTVGTAGIDTARVTFARSGITTDWHAQDDLTLLELAEELGVDVPSDCRAGACHTCRHALLDGDASATTPTTNGSRDALLCIGKPLTRQLTIDA